LLLPALIVWRVLDIILSAGEAVMFRIWPD